MSIYTLFGQSGTAGAATGTASITICCQFSVNTTIPLTGIWWNSPTSAVALPTACAIFDNTSQTEVTGTLNSSPTWSGAAGSGWVKCTYNGSVSLTSGHIYFVAVYNNSGTLWFASTAGYWTTGPGASGITNGPLSAPNNAGAVIGQDSVASGPTSIAFPEFTESGKNYWVDVELSTKTPSGLMMVAT